MYFFNSTVFFVTLSGMRVLSSSFHGNHGNTVSKGRRECYAQEKLSIMFWTNWVTISSNCWKDNTIYCISIYIIKNVETMID